jgi:hypothetical protein
MKCAACDSPDSNGWWFTTWNHEAICSPCSERGLGGDVGQIDRYAMEQLPDEVSPVHSWVVGMRDTVLDESSEWTEEERAQLAPGLNFLIELIEDELQQATEALGYVRGKMHGLPPHLLVDGLRSPASPHDPEWAQVAVRTAVRTTIRGWLNDLVTTAESTGLPAEQLPELLREVLAARASGDDTNNVVISLSRCRED